jgi:hypothetical protein
MKAVIKSILADNKMFTFRLNFLLLSILFVKGNFILAQQSNTLYYMKGVPQSHMLNPATKPPCNFYIGVPVVSLFQVNVENSGFSLSDVMWQDGDSTRIFFNRLEWQDDFLDNFGKSNYISADVNTHLISFGFKSGPTYISYDLTERVSFRFSYPRDLFKLLMKGNELGDEFDLSGFGIEAYSMMEFAVGVSREINDQLMVGTRTKILFGHTNISTRKTDMSIATDFDWVIRSRFDLNASLPMVDIPTDSVGDFKFDDIDTKDKVSSTDIVNIVTGNKGLAIDLGVHYKPIENLILSGSLIDLGFIRWKNNTYNISQDAEYVFDGLDVDLGETDSIFDNFIDTLENTFVFKSTEEPYTSFLAGKLYIGATYQIIEEISAGILLRSEIFKGRLREQLTLSANFYPARIVSASLSWTMMNRTFNNLGFGLSLKPGPFNIYIISDNIPLTFAVEQSSGAPIPYNARTMNFRFGINFIIGCNREKMKTRDLPLI